MSHNSSSRPTVSVAMCVYRPDARFFPAAVESVLRQTLEDLELVIVEDPSDRRGPDMLSGLDDRRIRHYVNPRRTSLVAQRNRALAEARAPLVAVLDADDLAEPERLELQARFFLERPEVDLAGSQVSVIDERGRVVGHRRFPLDHEPLLAAMHRIVPFCHPSVMYRRQAVVLAGGYQDTFGPLADDYDLYSRLSRRGALLANLPAPLTRYRLHGAQNKATQLRATIRAVLGVKRRYWLPTMDVGDRARMLAERALLLLPQRAVFALLSRLYYCDAVPPGREAPSFLPDGERAGPRTLTLAEE